MAAPRAPQGPQAWMDWANAMADEVDGNRPIGPGVSDSSTGAGKYIRGTGASAITPAAPCPLGASLVTVDGAHYVRFQFGVIQGSQPAGFAAGNLPPFQLPASSGNFYFASADYDSSTGLWSNPGISVQSADVANTTTIAYELLCSVGADASGKLTIASTCGNVWFDPCDLATS